MFTKFAAVPSVVSEWTELALTVVLLVGMGVFLGSFAFHQADLAVVHGLAQVHQAARAVAA